MKKLRLIFLLIFAVNSNMINASLQLKTNQYLTNKNYDQQHKTINRKYYIVSIL